MKEKNKTKTLYSVVFLLAIAAIFSLVLCSEVQKTVNHFRDNSDAWDALEEYPYPEQEEIPSASSGTATIQKAVQESVLRKAVDRIDEAADKLKNYVEVGCNYRHEGTCPVCYTDAVF